MSTVKSFLLLLQKNLNSKSLGSLRFVTGNQSADLDSVVSAIGYSYLNFRFDSTLSIPLINIPKEDFKLRRDIKLALESHSINEDILYFIEDFSRLCQKKTAEVVLVDHCNLQGDALIQALKDNKIKVVSIIDHHADENVFLDASPRIIHSNGSCSSLVFNYWYEKFSDKSVFAENSGEVASLFLAPLLIDTSNMSDKVEEGDILSFKHYEATLAKCANIFVADGNAQDPFKEYYKKLKSAKKDLSGFRFHEILRKDYKQFNFGGISIGFSSLSRSFGWLFANYSVDEILAGVDNLLQTFRLDALIITPSFSEDGQYHRQFGLIYNKNSNFHVLDRLDTLCQSYLQLDDELRGSDLIAAKTTEINKSKVFKIKNQGNLAASRKQIVPAVKDAIESNI